MPLQIVIREPVLKGLRRDLVRFSQLTASASFGPHLDGEP
jgi:hypothetical protein